jgi:hypothetical protein
MRNKGEKNSHVQAKPVEGNSESFQEEQALLAWDHGPLTTARLAIHPLLGNRKVVVGSRHRFTSLMKYPSNSPQGSKTKNGNK